MCSHIVIMWKPEGLTHLPLDKMEAILADDIFKCIFLYMKTIEFQFKFLTETCSQESNWQYNSIGSGNGLSPVRRQANVDPVLCHHMVSLGHNGLSGHWAEVHVGADEGLELLVYKSLP